MSDKEDSPRGSRSRSRGSEKDARASKSRSRSRSKASFRSRSRSDSRHRRSRSRSHSRRSHSRGRRYRSRSRSPYQRKGRRQSRSRSRSRGRRRYSPDDRHHGGGGGGSRYRSRSPMSRRKRHVGTREDPTTSRCLGVFGLSLYTQERDLREIFSRYGPVEDINVVYDHQTGRSRGFAFLYMRHIEDAEEAKERAPGNEIDGKQIRVDYSITQRAHTPTPGIYLGKATTRGYRENGAGRRGSDYYSRRSPSHGGGRRGGRHSRSRSRSRSYSPRRY